MERDAAAYLDFLASRDEVYELVRGCVEQVNADLAGEPEIANSQIHRFLILHKELDADDGELTRTRKVRRGFIGEKYANIVDALYAGSDRCVVEAQVRFEDLPGLRQTVCVKEIVWESPPDLLDATIVRLGAAVHLPDRHLAGALVAQQQVVRAYIEAGMEIRVYFYGFAPGDQVEVRFWNEAGTSSVKLTTITIASKICISF